MHKANAPLLSLALLLVAMLVAMLAACSRNATIPAEEPAPAFIGTVTLAPIDSPAALRTDNRSPPVVGWLWVGLANTVLDKDKSAAFDAAHADFRRQMGPRLVETLQRALTAKGYTVKMAAADQFRRDADGNLVAKSPADHEAILVVRIDEVAMYSRRLRPDYQPVVDVSALMTHAPARDPLFDASYMYGAYASTNENGEILPDPKYAFPNFEALMEQPALVEESYDNGMQLIVERLVQDFFKQFRPKAAPVRMAGKEASPSSGGETPRNPPVAAGKPKAGKAAGAGKKQAAATSPATVR